jgi:hypothetical protein
MVLHLLSYFNCYVKIYLCRRIVVYCRDFNSSRLLLYFNLLSRSQGSSILSKYTVSFSQCSGTVSFRASGSVIICTDPPDLYLDPYINKLKNKGKTLISTVL